MNALITIPGLHRPRRRRLLAARRWLVSFNLRLTIRSSPGCFNSFSGKGMRPSGWKTYFLALLAFNA
jgi:hypothetical protein